MTIIRGRYGTACCPGSGDGGGAMKYFNYDSYCGIYCGACDIMQAYQTGRTTRFTSFLKESTVKAIHRAMGLKYDDSRPFELSCQGCKTGSLFVNCSVCEIRKCAIERNIDHCVDCGDYPCPLFSEWQKMGLFLPHLKEAPGSLDAIQSRGVNRWLSEQEKRWKCPDCGTGFSWYSSKCAHCGRGLKGHAFRFGILKAGLMKLALNLSSLMPGKRK